jgi:predicted DNA-binding transcriptional regulator AlpA
MAMQSYLTEKQLSEKTGIPVKTLQYLRYVDRSPPYVKVGRSIRFPENRVEQWLNERLREQS